MRNRLKSRLAAAWMRWVPLGKPKAEPRHVRREVWSHSTRRMGLRFTERIRDAFRRSWLRIVKDQKTQERDV